MSQATAESSADNCDPLESLLLENFGIRFALLSGEDGQVVRDDPARLLQLDGPLAELARIVSQHGRPQIVAEDNSWFLLAIPITDSTGNAVVALAPFASRSVDSADDLSRAALMFSRPPNSIAHWINCQQPWPPQAALKLAEALTANHQTQLEIARLQDEINTVSDHLGTTYEEISLLYDVTQNLRISSSDEELGSLALQWLGECLPAKGLAIQFLSVTDDRDVTYQARTASSLLHSGDCPIDNEQFLQLRDFLQLDKMDRPYVANRSVTQAADWPFPSVHELIVVPLAEGDNVFGYMAAFNHRQAAEFGTVEATLLSSVAAILGIHSGNCELYRQQAEFLASVVRALTSAIDAKDPYTCGHSDRVARISVKLAKEIGFDEEGLNTIYMSGLLHDIGKIGIDDNVLRKPGALTPAEFEHIKLHPELGYKILADLKQLSECLPAVLHHHEQWDGGGYPHGLAGEKIPQIARIVAVADAYDAMTSDRPYRAGMPEVKVEEIFRAGAGKQWDAAVIAAYFRVREGIRDIAQRERANLSLDVQQWS